MATIRVIQSVLGNFLGTYTSRNSDYEGYWLFGLLVAELDELRIDLLATPTSDGETPLDFAVRLAVAKFADQFEKSGLVPSQIEQARLSIRKVPAISQNWIYDVRCEGFEVRFSALALMQGEREFEKEVVVFVAPHNRTIERQSTRAPESP